MFKAVAQAHGFYSPRLMEQIAAAGSIQKMSSIPEDVRRVFVTALDISPIWHVKMMAAFQSFADGAVSKTVNLPKKARPKDVKAVFLAAHEHECKGITVYRDGSRSNQPMERTGDTTSVSEGSKCACNECALS